jgi:hypothetical protein
MATATEQQAQDQAGGTPQAFDFDKGSLDEFTAKMETDKAFRQEYLDNPFDKKYDRVNELYQRKKQGENVDTATAPPAASSAAAADQADPAKKAIPSEQSGEEEFEVTIKVPKNLLVNDRNNYLANRPPDQAVLEALKGKSEADRFIGELNTRLNHTSTETIDLRKKLAELSAKAAETPVSATPAATPTGQPSAEASERVEFDEDPEDIDLFHPDNEAKIRKVLKSYLTEKPSPSAATPPEKEKIVSQMDDKEIKRLSLQKEFDEILSLQSEYPELRTPVPFDKMDKAVFDFLADVGKAIGVKDPETAEGQNEAKAKFFAQGEAGESVRKLCESKSIKVPEGIDAHDRIMQIRAIRYKNREAARLSMSKKTGREFTDIDVPEELPGVTYRTAFKKEGESPSLTEFMRKAQIAGHKEAEAAAEAMQGVHATTVPHDMGTAPLMDPGVMPWNEFVSMVNQPIDQLKPDQARIIVEAARKFGVIDDVPKYIIDKSKG